MRRTRTVVILAQFGRCVLANSRSPSLRVPATRQARRSTTAAQLLQRGQATRGIASVWISRVPRIAGEDRRNHTSHKRRRVGMKNDPLKAAAVPRFDEGAEGIDAALQRRDEFGLPIDGFAGELPVERRRRKARRLEGNRDAGRKNRVEKLTSVAEEREAAATERFYIGRITDQPPRRRVPARLAQQFLQAQILRNKAL